MSAFPERLKYLRSINNISQKKLASSLNVSQNAIYNWERDKNEVFHSTLEEISRFLSFYNKIKLLIYFRQLNNKGQSIAIDRLNELTQIPQYKKH